MLVRYCEVKKKPAWASVRDHWREKIGSDGARILVMMPMRMKPACNKNHSKRGLGAEGDETVESIERGSVSQDRKRDKAARGPCGHTLLSVCVEVLWRANNAFPTMTAFLFWTPVRVVCSKRATQRAAN